MKHLLVLLLLAAAANAKAADWTFSVMIAGGSADIVSSLGRYEANPLARGPSGRFSVRRALPLKAGICAGLWLVRRRWPTTGKVAMATAGIAWTAAAVRNRGT